MNAEVVNYLAWVIFSVVGVIMLIFQRAIRRDHALILANQARIIEMLEKMTA